MQKFKKNELIDQLREAQARLRSGSDAFTQLKLKFADLTEKKKDLELELDTVSQTLSFTAIKTSLA